MKPLTPRSIYYSMKILNDPRLKLADRAVLGFISYWDKCFASNDYIAKFLGCSKSTVSRSIKKTTRLGYIIKNEVFEKNGRKTYLRTVIPELKYKPVKTKSKYKNPLKPDKPINKDFMRYPLKDEGF